MGRTRKSGEPSRPVATRTVMMNHRVPKDLKDRFMELVECEGRTASKTLRVLIEDFVKAREK